MSEFFTEAREHIAKQKEQAATSEGEPVKEETKEEQAAMTLAFVCALGNEKAREIIARIKEGNILFVKFTTTEKEV